AAWAIATPILPVDRLPINLTGSIASAVPPAVTTTRQPTMSKLGSGEITGGRRDGSGCLIGRPSSAFAAAATIVLDSASRPWPTAPDASGPTSGSTIE